MIFSIFDEELGSTCQLKQERAKHVTVWGGKAETTFFAKRGKITDF